MKIIAIDNDIKIFYVQATSYPDGIFDAHQKLHSIVPFSADRKYFGLSRPENEKYEIFYKAGTEEIEVGEAEKYNCETLIIKSGKYVCTTVKGFRNDVLAISKAFQELLTQPDLDPEGYCLEWYSNTAEVVKCMVRLN